MTFKRTKLGLQKQIIIYEYERGLLYEDGKFTTLLDPGKYTYWRWDSITVTRVSTRQMSQVVSGQEILTKDRVEVRLSLVAQYVVQDPVLAVNSVENYSENLYQDLQLELRNSVVAREIDELLEARAELSAELLEKVAPLALDYGIQLKRVGVRDIILPRNVRNVFMQEVEADRAGRAELVRARHEVAAARARANTAKILTENPHIAHLQEIDAMVKIAGQHGNVIILPDITNLFNRNKDG